MDPTRLRRLHQVAGGMILAALVVMLLPKTLAYHMEYGPEPRYITGSFLGMQINGYKSFTPFLTFVMGVAWAVAAFVAAEYTRVFRLVIGGLCLLSCLSLLASGSQHLAGPLAIALLAAGAYVLQWVLFIIDHRRWKARLEAEPPRRDSEA